MNEPIWDIPEIIMRREYNALYGEMHEPSISFEDFYKFWNEKSRNWQYEERIKALIDHYETPRFEEPEVTLSFLFSSILQDFVLGFSDASEDLRRPRGRPRGSGRKEASVEQFSKSLDYDDRHSERNVARLLSYVIKDSSENIRGRLRRSKRRIDNYDKALRSNPIVQQLLELVEQTVEKRSAKNWDAK